MVVAVEKTGIRQLRERAGMTQVELAQAAEISTSTLVRIEHPEQQRPVKSLVAWRVLNVLNDKLGTDYSLTDLNIQFKI